ncbi:MAG: transcriptional regulator [Spirochaetales bacterium]|nr:transcriptional regulator [Spirochaetales bacterium]
MAKLDLNRIDNILTSKYRLAVLALLSSGDEIDFSFFKKELDISDGNLSTHMTKLEKAGYITVKKQFKGKRPKTTYRITDIGLKQYESYLNEIAKLF